MNKTFVKLFIYLASRFFPIDEKQISLIVERYSGSNTLALYKFLPEDIRDYFSVSLIDLSSVTFKIGDEKKTNFLKYYSEMSKSKIIISDHGSRKLKKKQININTWHGFPLKSMGRMALGSAHLKIRKIPRVDYNISYSQLYSVLLSACFGYDITTFKILGAPRNDFLFKSDGKYNLQKLLDLKIENEKILLFMPTFREGYKGTEGKAKSNIFGLEDFNLKEFNDFLRVNNLLLIIKPHIVEIPHLIKKLKAIESNNVFVVTDEDCKKLSIDFYEALNSIDILITDYSSIYFDFLLLDRPMIFIPTDLKEYRENRGLLLEPYDFWTPGPKVFNQQELQREIIKSLNDQLYYSSQRQVIANIVHEFKDDNSSKRVWNFVRSLSTTNTRRVLK